MITYVYLTLRFLVIMVAGCGIFGCAAHHPLHIENAIFVEPDGSPVINGIDGIVAEANYDAHLKKIGRAIKQSGKKKILIFVHGGLNTLDDGLNKAATIEAIKKDSEYFPIFVNWKSDFLSTYWEHLFLIRQGEVEPVYGPPTSPAILLEDLGRMVAKIPISLFRQTENDFKAMTFPSQPYRSGCPEKYDHYVHSWIQATNALTCTLTDDYRAGKPKSINISLGNAEDVRWYNLDGFGRLGANLITLPLKYATVPFLDGFAAPSWDNMVRRTKTMYQRPTEFDIRKQVQNNYNDPAAVKEVAQKAAMFKETGALARLLNGLNDVAAGGAGVEVGLGMPMQAKGTTKVGGEYEITVIGHSMGTIVLNEFIRNYETYPNLKIKNIVYMAAACTIRDFERSIIPYMRSDKGKDAHFYNLTLHPWNDARETNALGIVPRGSLLEWIDNFLTTPSTPLDRTLGKWENIVQSTHIIPDDIRSRVSIKGFSVCDDKAKCGPQKHGEFDDYDPNGTGWKFWTQTFWEP